MKTNNIFLICIKHKLRNLIPELINKRVERIELLVDFFIKCMNENVIRKSRNAIAV